MSESAVMKLHCEVVVLYLNNLNLDLFLLPTSVFGVPWQYNFMVWKLWKISFPALHTATLGVRFISAGADLQLNFYFAQGSIMYHTQLPLCWLVTPPFFLMFFWVLTCFGEMVTFFINEPPTRESLNTSQSHHIRTAVTLITVQLWGWK